jgi:hypothetical protein
VVQKLIDDDGVRHHLNPAIFEKAISSSSNYDEDIKADAGQNNEDIFSQRGRTDIQRAAISAGLTKRSGQATGMEPPCRPFWPATPGRADPDPLESR